MYDFFLTVAEQTVRLADGSCSFEGHVEILMNSVWGTVCDSGWSFPEADVFCRKLGYTRANLVWKGAWFGEEILKVSYNGLRGSCHQRDIVQ